MPDAALLLLARRQRPFPAAPPREQVCAVRVGFQGVTIQSEQYGAFPAFGPETTTLNDADLASHVQQCLAAGFTHTEIAVSWNYAEPTYTYPVPGRDLSQNLSELKRRIALMVQSGAPHGLRGVLVFCAGDGESPAGGGYSDPQGWTYGRGWLMANFARIYAALGPQPGDPIDVRPWCVFVPGYDGCWYGWQDAESVRQWWRLCRGVIAAAGGYQGFEYAAGLCHLGDGEDTYGPDAGQCVDVWLQEFPVGPLPSDAPDQVWQIMGRLCRPYNRPPEQPAGDDPSPPYLLASGTPRGPWFWIAYEFDTYRWVRGCAASAVAADRAYLRQLGATWIC